MATERKWLRGTIFRQHRSGVRPPWWKKAGVLYKANAAGKQASATTPLLAAWSASCRSNNIAIGSGSGPRWQQKVAGGSFPIVDVGGRFMVEGEGREASGEQLHHVVDSTIPEWCDVTIHADYIPHPVLVRHRDRWFWVDAERTKDWADEDMVRIVRAAGSAFHIEGLPVSYPTAARTAEAWSERMDSYDKAREARRRKVIEFMERMVSCGISTLKVDGSTGVHMRVYPTDDFTSVRVVFKLADFAGYEGDVECSPNDLTDGAAIRCIEHVRESFEYDAGNVRQNVDDVLNALKGDSVSKELRAMLEEEVGS